MADDRGYDRPATWDEYRRMVLDRLETTAERLDELTRAMSRLEVEIAILRTKIMIFATIAGTLSGTVISLAIAILSHALLKY